MDIMAPPRMHKSGDCKYQTLAVDKKVCSNSYLLLQLSVAKLYYFGCFRIYASYIPFLVRCFFFLASSHGLIFKISLFYHMRLEVYIVTQHTSSSRD